MVANRAANTISVLLGDSLGTFEHHGDYPAGGSQPTSVVADGLRIVASDEPPVCIADDEADFADETVRLLNDIQERTSLASRGREFVENHFVWSRSAERLEQMCLAALEKGPSD